MLESLFNRVDSKDIKEAPTQVFPCEYCEICINFFYGTPPVGASAVLKNSYIFKKTSVAEAHYIYVFNKYD